MLKTLRVVNMTEFGIKNQTPSSKIDEIIYLSIKTRKSEKKNASSK
jgi:hypothetical protein